jgi:hypothetical protein
MVRLFVGKPTFTICWVSSYMKHIPTGSLAGTTTSAPSTGYTKHHRDIKVDGRYCILKKLLEVAGFLFRRSISVVDLPSARRFCFIPVETNGLFVWMGRDFANSHHSKILGHVGERTPELRPATLPNVSVTNIRAGCASMRARPDCQHPAPVLLGRTRLIFALASHEHATRYPTHGCLGVMAELGKAPAQARPPRNFITYSQPVRPFPD